MSSLFREIITLLPGRQIAYFLAFFTVKLATQFANTIVYKQLLAGAKSDEAVQYWLAAQLAAIVIDYTLMATLIHSLTKTIHQHHINRHHPIFMAIPRELRAGTGPEYTKHMESSYQSLKHTVNQFIQIISTIVDIIACMVQIIIGHTTIGTALIAAATIFLVFWLKYPVATFNKELKASSKLRSKLQAFNEALVRLLGGADDNAIARKINANRRVINIGGLTRDSFWVRFNSIAQFVGLIMCCVIWVGAGSFSLIVLFSMFGYHIQTIVNVAGFLSFRSVEHAELIDFENRLRIRDNDKTTSTANLPDCLEITNINFSHHLAKTATMNLNGSIRINHGDHILVYGASGNGKSTLAELISGIIGLYTLGDELPSPRYVLNGEVRSMRQYRGVYFVRYEDHSFSVDTTLRELFDVFHGSAKAWQVLEIMGLTQWAKGIGGLDAPIGKMSTGEKRRLCSCCMLIKPLRGTESKKLIILDEIIANMNWQADAAPILSRLFETFRGHTIILIEHSSDARLTRWDQQIEIIDGKITQTA